MILGFHRFMRTAQRGMQPTYLLHETPVSMRVWSTRRSLQCGLGQGKVNRKSLFSTNFFGIWPYFAYICLISPGFRGFGRADTAQLVDSTE
jgi:hypothetical protein